MKLLFFPLANQELENREHIHVFYAFKVFYAAIGGIP
jgi:hypothetical protein